MKNFLQGIHARSGLQKMSLISGLLFFCALLMASSHREAPLIASDPLADNVDVYAFRSPDDPSTITLIATYVPLQLPHGGPNYYNFGENIRYEIHVDNDASVPGDEITYRFTFNIVNEDPTTFFNMRLGSQNQKATYTLERSTDGGQTFEVIVENGVVPPYNVGLRSIEGGAGLNTTYPALFESGIMTASTGERVFAGPTDDPFFVDLGGIFDLGNAPRQDGEPVDGVACYNVSALVLQVPIAMLLKEGAPAEPTNILDADYVIGVWASASRPAITTLSSSADPSYDGNWVQVSRLGMPLTNEAVIPIGQKDYWNRLSPYDEITETTLDQYFFNPELALYMDDDLFGGAVPAFAPLRVQTNSLGAFDFSNGADGLFGLKGSEAVAGTALDDAVFGGLLLPGPGMPRSVDLWPAFHTGVPNVIPYQLATGKEGNPLAAGKPFVNNFLPNGGDMLRLNMAVPPTPRDDANFSSLGLIQAAAIGLTVAPFNTRTDLEFLPNMDGFPNGRRLEDDVTRIELQAVSGIVLAAIGLWYDDYDPATSPSPVTQQLLNVLTYSTGVEKNDKDFSGSFPYLAMPFSGDGPCSGRPQMTDNPMCFAEGGLLTTSDGKTHITICAGDGVSDAFDVSLTGESGDAFAWVITDEDGKVLDLPSGPPFDLENAGTGRCKIYHVSYSEGATLPNIGGNINDLMGCADASDAITVDRQDPAVCADQCAAPSEFDVEQLSSTRFIIRWEPVESAESYVLRIRFANSSRWFVFKVRSRHQATIAAPTNNTYIYQVKSICGDGEESAYSDTQTYTLNPESKSTVASSKRSFTQADLDLTEGSRDILAFPNPVDKTLEVNYTPVNTSSTLEVYKVTGEKVYEAEVPANSNYQHIDFSSLSEGTYYLAVRQDDEIIYTEQIVKVKQ